jgi:hypothetical protein
MGRGARRALSARASLHGVDINHTDAEQVLDFLDRYTQEGFSPRIPAVFLKSRDNPEVPSQLREFLGALRRSRAAT